MAKTKALTDDRLAELWRAVKEQDSDSFWDELKAEQLLTAKRIIETALEQEMIAQVCAGRYERSGRRRGIRVRARRQGRIPRPFGPRDHRRAGSAQRNGNPV